MKILILASGSGGNIIKLHKELKKHFIFIYNSIKIKKYCDKYRIQYFYTKKVNKNYLNILINIFKINKA